MIFTFTRQSKKTKQKSKRNNIKIQPKEFAVTGYLIENQVRPHIFPFRFIIYERDIQKCVRVERVSKEQKRVVTREKSFDFPPPPILKKQTNKRVKEKMRIFDSIYTLILMEYKAHVCLLTHPS